MPCARPLLAAARVAAPFLCAASAAASASLVVVALFPVGLPFRRANLLGEALATARPAGGCTAGLVALGWAARTLVGLEGWRLGVVSLSASLSKVDACTSALPSHCRCSTIAAHPMAAAWLRQKGEGAGEGEGEGEGVGVRVRVRVRVLELGLWLGRGRGSHHSAACRAASASASARARSAAACFRGRGRLRLRGRGGLRLRGRGRGSGRGRG